MGFRSTRARSTTGWLIGIPCRSLPIASSAPSRRKWDCSGRATLCLRSAAGGNARELWTGNSLALRWEWMMRSMRLRFLPCVAFGFSVSSESDGEGVGIHLETREVEVVVPALDEWRIAQAAAS